MRHSAFRAIAREGSTADSNALVSKREWAPSGSNRRPTD